MHPTSNGSDDKSSVTGFCFFMKEIKLTKGFVALVDDEDYEELNKFKWRAVKVRNNYYAYRLVSMHREILNLKDSKQHVDHKDRNTLNNCKSNIRQCNPGQNNLNKEVRKDSQTGVKGVRYHKKKNRYIANIRINGKQKEIGKYKTLEEAKVAYNKKAKEVHGEFYCGD